MTDRLAWTAEQIKLARHLFLDLNMTATEIAGEMSRRYHTFVTRSAVCGKLSRLGICRPEGADHRDRPRPRVRRARRHVARVAAPPVAPATPPPKPPKHPITLLDFTNETCRWPVGNDPEPPLHSQLFCGTRDADLAAGVPYCRKHSRLAYAPPRARLLPHPTW